MAAFSTLALILSGLGVASQVRAQLQAGNAAATAGSQQREAANSQAELSDFNAAVAEQQAKDAIQRGTADEQRFRQGVRGIIGSQRAAFAASNVDVGFGSAVDVQADAAFLGELDALTIRTNAAREAWGFSVQAADARKRAEVARKEGVNLEAAGQVAKSAARVAATGTILGGASSLLQTRYGFGGR